MLSRRNSLAGTIANGATSLSRGQTGGAASVVLRLERRDIEVNGKSTSIFCIRQPGGTLRITTDAGTPFRVRVENILEAPSLIHWHGLTPSWRQDGVPEISGPAILAGGSADYDFPLRRGGTYWMHSHYGLQEQLLLSAPLINKDGSENPNQQEIALMLADFLHAAGSDLCRPPVTPNHIDHLPVPADPLLGLRAGLDKEGTFYPLRHFYIPRGH
jgi:FtsP/CotA-like multicopper oxidase with cupredoxin domain